MAVLNADVRMEVLDEVRREIIDLARLGRSVTEIDQELNGDRTLSEVERDLVYLLTYHAVRGSEEALMGSAP